jgi:hypothetical protein
MLTTGPSYRHSRISHRSLIRVSIGFCGSLTTFSAWQEDVFLAFSNASGFHRGWFRDVRLLVIYNAFVGFLMANLGTRWSQPYCIHYNNLFILPQCRPSPIHLNTSSHTTGSCALSSQRSYPQNPHGRLSSIIYYYHPTLFQTLPFVPPSRNSRALILRSRNTSPPFPRCQTQSYTTVSPSWNISSQSHRYRPPCNVLCSSAFTEFSFSERLLDFARSN